MHMHTTIASIWLVSMKKRRLEHYDRPKFRTEWNNLHVNTASEEVISTLLHVTFGVGSPLASQGMINSLPTSWRYSGRGRTLNIGGS